MAVDTLDDKYRKYCDLYQRIRAVIAGKPDLVELVSALPQPMYRDLTTQGLATKQTESIIRQQILQTKRRAAYWGRGVLMNATGRTHISTDGMLWAKDPEVLLPPQLSYMIESADGAGNGLREVVQDLTDELTSVGRYGILVDMPASGGNPTAAQMKSGELAPRLIRYKAEQIIYYRCSGTSTSVDEIRLREVRSIKKSEFDWEDAVYIRRLFMRKGVYVNQLYDDKGKLESEVEPVANGAKLNAIPFQFFGSDANSPEYSKPTLLDLALTNIGHFVLDCDNRDNLHYHGQGMTNVYTAMDSAEFNERNPNGLDCGSKGMNQLDQNDRVEILQLGATGAIAAEMERDEKRMIAQGAQLVQDTNTNVTLGAKEMEFGASTATLKRIGRNASIGIEQCLGWAAKFVGATGEIKYRLNDKFITDDLTPEELNAYFGLMQGGVIPKSMIYSMMRQNGITEKTDDEIADELEMEQSTGGTTEEVAAMQAEIERLTLAAQGGNA